MIVVSNSSEYLSTSSLQGVKIAVHPQESHPFPNGQGYVSSVGQQVGLVVTKVSQLVRTHFAYMSPFRTSTRVSGRRTVNAALVRVWRLTVNRFTTTAPTPLK